ncbi:hypothetical protein ELI07_08745 [Rhizobium leguminosarum]|uniref:hypothetical protein n=1 Tax=Rhizobium leguminosarum TaxID=384 RepID=UPI00102FFB88|nr:hypothetical protein [Rhizobium leguminosarum]TAX12534.1 hypothetical protein ELI07_08745 [Rhizobium leguminosarum]
MAFRADEAVAAGYEKLKTYLIPRHLSGAERNKSEEQLFQIVSECGPAVESYPTWHPLVRNHDEHNPETLPSERSGYPGVDHTRYLAHGFITCPYGDGQQVVDAVNQLPFHPAATISAERLNVTFYNESATPILVRCQWENDPLEDYQVPKRIAVPLMLEQELPCWRWSQRAETWETMRPYLLGEPHGSRSSLFVSQDTALAMKKIYLSMVESGMFGNPKTH